MDATPSIRSSYKPGQSVQYQFAKPAAHEALQKLVNNCLEGFRIYQNFEGEKAKIPLSKGTFYALVQENPVESGFLVFSPRHTPIFLTESKQRAYVIRMRLSATMHSQTAIFAASLDKSDGYLWIEDALYWNDQKVISLQPFTERRKILKSFLEHHWMPDARCAGGLTIRIANYTSLEKLKEFQDETSFSFVDLCPELPDRRRFRLRSAGGRFSSLVAEIKAVSGLPDVYELWSAEDICVGRAAIQELSLSKKIRETIAREKIYVQVEWNAQFSKFRIVKIVPAGTARSPTTRFTSVSKSKPEAPPQELLIVDEEESEE
jgi:hypothetical protein